MIVRELITRLGFDVDQTKIKSFETSLNSISKKAERLGKSMVSIRKQMSLFASVPIGLLGASLIKAASDAEEAENRFIQVFGNLSKEADVFSRNLAEQVGRSQIEIKDSLATFQQFSQGLGMAGKDSIEFSKKISSLALDFASFNNVSDAEAQQRFISALSGSSEVLDKFGINIKAAALEQELLNMGIKGSINDATELSKTIARLNIIEKVLGRNGAVGDAVRTQASFANRYKAFKSSIKDLSISFGEILLPIATKLLKALTGVIRSFEKISPTAKKLIISVLALVAAIGPLLIILGGIVQLLPIIKTGFAVFGIIFSKVGLIIAAVAAYIAGLWLLFDDFTGWLNGKNSLFGPIYEKFIPGFEYLKSLFEDISLVFKNDIYPIVEAVYNLFESLIVSQLKQTKELLKALISLSPPLKFLISLLGKVIEKFDFIEIIVKSIKSLLSSIPLGFLAKLISSRAEDIRSGNGANAAQGIAEKINYVSEVINPSPISSIPSSGIGSNQINNVNINQEINVNTETNASAEDIGKEVSKQTERANKRQMRQAGLMISSPLRA